MAKRTAGFGSSICLFSIRLALFTPAIFLLWEIEVPRSSLSQVETGVQDIPEEMLQTQITTEANSLLTGLAQSANSSATEQKQLQVTATEVPPVLTPSIYRSVELLRLRKLLKSLLPFF
jgi:hypothetical protein